MEIKNKKISKIISLSLLSFSLLLLLYVIYKDIFVITDVEFNNYYYHYYALIIIFLIFSIYSFWISYALKINILLFFSSILISLYSIEFYLIYNHHYKVNDYNLKKDFDKTTKLQFYSKELKSDSTTVPTVPPKTNLKNYLFFPLSGVSNSNTIMCNELGYFSKYKSDRFGFNNNNDLWETEIIDAVTIGDSFAHGECVNYNDTIAGKLINKYNLKALNLGYSGNGPLTEYATIKEYLPRNIKTLIWIYYEGNDLSDLSKELKNPILKNYINNNNYSQNLIYRKNEIDNFLRKKIKISINEKLNCNPDCLYLWDNFYQSINFIKNEDKKFDYLRLLKLYTLRELTINFLFPLEINSNFEKILLNVKNELIKQDKNLLFVYLPDQNRYKKKIYNHSKFLNYKGVINIIEKNNIDFLDFNKIFIKNFDEPSNLYANKIAGHFNVKGYEFIADMIFNKINK